MTALTQDKNIARRDGMRLSYPVASSVTLYAGAMVALNNNGYAVPAGHASAHSDIVGIAAKRVQSQSRDGAEHITVERGVFMFDNDSNASHRVSANHIGKQVYALDDQTVTRNHASNSRKIVGKVLMIDDESQNVWVIVG